MSSLSICLRLKVSIKSSALGEHWRALTFETETLQNPYIFLSLQLYQKVTSYTKKMVNIAIILVWKIAK